MLCKNAEVDVRRCFVKKAFFKIPPNSQKNTWMSLFFNKVGGWKLQVYFKRDWHICFPMNFTKILGTPFLQNTSGELLLKNWLYDPNLWKISMKKFNFSKVAGLEPATLIKIEHFHRHIFISLVWCRTVILWKISQWLLLKEQKHILLNIITKENVKYTQLNNKILT